MHGRETEMHPQQGGKIQIYRQAPRTRRPLKMDPVVNRKGADKRKETEETRREAEVRIQAKDGQKRQDRDGGNV